MKEDRPVSGPSPKTGSTPGPQPLREPSTDTTVQRVSRWSREIPLLASLRTRLVLLVLAGIVPFLGLVIYSAIDERYRAGERAHEEARQVARMAGARQDQSVESARQLLTALALLREVQSLDKESCSRIFSNLREIHPGYVNIGVFRPDGRPIAIALPFPEETDMSDHLWFRLAVGNRSFATGEFLVSADHKQASLNVACPAIDEAGELRAVIYASLDLGWLKTMIASSTLPPGSSVTLMDSNRVTIVRYPDPEGKITGSILGSFSSRTNDPSPALRTNVPPRLARAFRRSERFGEFGRESTYVFVGRDGVRRLYATMRFGHTGQAGQTSITVGIPVEAAFGPADRSLRRNLLVVGAVALIVWAIVWYGGTIFILRRVKVLLRATDRISVGDYSARVGGPYGAGELHLLSKAFDDMAAALQRRTQEREKAEAKLRALNEELESRVTRRTAQLKRSNEDLEQFAYVASHDLQEPLRMVSRYVELLRDRYGDQFDAKAKEFLGFALDGARRMEELILALLAYSRVDTQGQPFERTDCNAVVERALANLRAAIEDSHAVVTVDPLPKLMADEVQLGQVFQNLLGNAIKFRGNKPPEIRVSAKQEGDDWHFAVRDNGIGISEENFQRIFVIFQRLHTRTKYPGTGIGLSLCKKIVERHGGRIWAESKLGEGSTFHLTLPARHEPPTHIKPGPA
jgi:signal transduction histidine kinase